MSHLDLKRLNNYLSYNAEDLLCTATLFVTEKIKHLISIIVIDSIIF